MKDRRAGVLALIGAVALVGVGCDDPFEPDPVPLYAGSAELISIMREEAVGRPSAFDFTPQPIGPEPVVVEAVGMGQLWDVLLSEQDGELVLVPSGAIEGGGDAALVVEAERTFGEVDAAPAQGERFETDVVPLRPDVVYIVRSRAVGTTRGTCVYFGKFHAVEVDAAAGTLTFEYVANPNCSTRGLDPAEDP